MEQNGFPPRSFSLFFPPTVTFGTWQAAPAVAASAHAMPFRTSLDLVAGGIAARGDRSGADRQARREQVIGFGAVELGYQTLGKLSDYLGGL